jgi:hypothetical protein
MPLAVGTSLVVIAMQSFAGFAGHLASEQIDWRLAAFITAAAVVGALIGARLTAMVNPDALRKAFGWFVLAMSSVILAQEIYLSVGIAAAALTAIARAMSHRLQQIRALPAAAARPPTGCQRCGDLSEPYTPTGNMGDTAQEGATP